MKEIVNIDAQIEYASCNYFILVISLKCVRMCIECT